MEVTLLGTGIQSNIEAQIDPSRAALRAGLQPLEWIVAGTQGGHYALQATTGSMAALAAAGQIFALRWNDASKLFLLLRCAVSAVCTAFSSGTGADLELIRATSYTANATGGTAITPSTVSQIMRGQAMASSSFNSSGELRIATTVALGAGTQTLDTAGVGAAQLGATGAGGGSALMELFNCLAYGQHPLVLANNMGLVIREVTAVPASNNFRYSVQLAWLEIPAF